MLCFCTLSHLQEGELRPQLLDRFGMSVNVRTLLDVGQRTQLVLDRLAFEQDQEAFIESVRPEQEALTAKLVAARELLPK
jgi:Mg-chelatase subunit ChlI